MITIDEHTFDETLLNENSRVLDAGCRGFGFANWLVDNIGCEVTCIDADPRIENPNNQKINYLNRVITHDESNEKLNFYVFGNGTANFSEEVSQRPTDCIEYKLSTYKIKSMWDLIKLDIEGAEYDILRRMESPLAKQISVEFHQHTAAKKSDAFLLEMFNHISQWYEIINAVPEERHGCGKNYWDVLLKLKN